MVGMEMNYMYGQTCRRCGAPLFSIVLAWMPCTFATKSFATGKSLEPIMFASDLINEQNISCIYYHLNK